MPPAPVLHNFLGKRSTIRLLLTGLFITIALIATGLGYKQFRVAVANGINLDRTTADISAQVLSERQKATLGILTSYASRPLVVRAVQNRDVAAIHDHMADLKNNYSEMDLTFLTDPQGVLWANYPVFPEALGKDLSDRDWYRGISAHWQPYVSTAFKLIIGEQPLAVSYCVPVLEEKGAVIGILGNSYRLTSLDAVIDRIRVEPGVKLTVIDQAGNLIYSSDLTPQQQVRSYPYFSEVAATLRNPKNPLTLAPHSKEEVHLTLAPIPTTGWTVIVERKTATTLRSLSGRFGELATIALLLFLLVASVVLYQHRLYRRTADLLQTEIRLRHSEDRHKTLVNNAPGIIYSYSARNGGSYYSPQVESILGYPSDYLLAHPSLWHDSIHPDDLPAVEQLIKNPALGRKDELEYRIRDARGEWLWLNDRSLGTASATGEIVITGLATDITPQKKIQESLDKIRREQQIILDNTVVGISMIVDRKQVWMNRKVEELFGYAIEEMVGQTTRKLYPSQEAYEQLGQDAYPILAQGKTFETEQLLLRRDGTQVLIKYNGKAIDPQDLSKGTIWILEDITERKRAEEQIKRSEHEFRMLAEAMPQIVWICNPDGKNIYFNQQWVEYTGLTLEESYGDGWNKPFHPEDQKQAWDAWRKATTTGAVYSLECRLRRADGIYQWWLIRGEPVKDELGRTSKWFGTCTDIEGIKLTEEQLTRSLQEKTVMLQEIHHRVKNNMQVIYSLLSLQAKEISDEGMQAKFEESRDRVFSMALIHEKLYRSDNLAYVDFKEYLLSLAAGVADSYKRPEIKIEVEMEAVALDVNVGIPCGLIANELLSNCFKYAFPPGREGTIKIGITVNGQGEHLFFVADNGIGFPAELDFRETSSLGLQLVIGLTQQIRGTIEISREGGTSFAITFQATPTIG